MDTKRLLEALPVAVYTTDAEGRITFYNQAAADFWGYRPESLPILFYNQYHHIKVLNQAMPFYIESRIPLQVKSIFQKIDSSSVF